jgi:hypothetical protein
MNSRYSKIKTGKQGSRTENSNSKMEMPNASHRVGKKGIAVETGELCSS